MDEKPIQLLADRRQGIAMEKGKPERQDSEYVCKGCSIFLFTEPLQGWRVADAREHRTRTDWAQHIERLFTIDYPKAEKIVLVMDNLNAHGVPSLYDSFPVTVGDNFPVLVGEKFPVSCP